ncbi:MAG TPA: tetratricopeptide repeat protein, partial [Thermoguttaceae bacterium]|nr:tetratricopeptide repeat protein [Thermoguttaceae bacterium]
MASKRKRKRKAVPSRSSNSPSPAAARAAARPAARRRLSLRKKVLFGGITAVMVFAVLELTLTVAGVQPVLYSEDPYVGFSSRIPLFVEQSRADGRVEMVTAQNRLRFFGPQRFDKAKSANSYRIFCLGGSTTYGRPYDDKTSFCGWLREFLPAADSSRDWEVINAGGVSYASYRVAMLAEELIRYEPDLFIVYSGQNEFLERRTYDRIINMPRVVRGLGAVVSHTRTYAALKQAVDMVGGQSSGNDNEPNLLAAEVDALLDHSVGPKDYHRDDVLRDQVIEHYRYNLNRMIDIAQSVGAKVVLVTPASNLRHCSPFKSEHRDELSAEQLERWQIAFESAKASHAAGQWSQSLAAIDEAAVIDDRYAHLHYLRGQVLFELERFDAAKAAFERARDEDVCPLRALGPMLQIVAEVADERGVPLIDFVEMVEGRAEHGIPGKGQFLDHVHPTVEGHRLLALQLLDEMANEKIVCPTEQWGDAAIGQVTERVEGSLDRRTHGIALRNLSKVLGWAGKLEEARELARQATELVPDDAEAHFEAALGAAAAGDASQAIDLYRRAVQLDPRYVEAHNNLGTLLDERGDFVGAEEHFRRAIAIDPDDHKAYFNLAQLLLKQANFVEAAKHFRRVIELRPGDSLAHTQLAAALVPLGQITEAISCMEAAIALVPDDADAHNKLGALRAEQGDYQAALRCYHRALELAPEHNGAIENLAWLLATAPDDGVRDGDEAVRLAELVSKQDGSNDPATLDALSAAYAEAGQYDRAVSTAYRALDLADAQGQIGL